MLRPAWAGRRRRAPGGDEAAADRLFAGRRVDADGSRSLPAEGSSRGPRAPDMPDETSPMRSDATALEFVLHTAEERAIRFVRLCFDVLGLPKSLAIPVSELEQA